DAPGSIGTRRVHSDALGHHPMPERGRRALRSRARLRGCHWRGVLLLFEIRADLGDILGANRIRIVVPVLADEADDPGDLLIVEGTRERWHAATTGEHRRDEVGRVLGS